MLINRFIKEYLRYLFNEIYFILIINNNNKIIKLKKYKYNLYIKKIYINIL